MLLCVINMCRLGLLDLTGINWDFLIIATLSFLGWLLLMFSSTWCYNNSAYLPVSVDTLSMFVNNVLYSFVQHTYYI